ncbi:MULTISPECIES: hypothetical protein [unclassified Bradyrhizobium]|uniref:hypothetical protein n=1 Tax=unclassified Bradyrhizobium TaxID=2631580 RepID=UPI0028F0D842|nr:MULTISPECIES: hypothetical protein [unclassified Bradyrhizobium]
MNKIATVGVAAALATALSGPALAKHVKGHRNIVREQTMPQQADAGWNNNGWDRRNSGFWPVDVAAGAVGTAAGVAGAAVGTAGAIATAPFRAADAYAYDPGPYHYSQPAFDRGPTGYYGNWDSYATRNGLACRPGTMFKGSDGVMHLCQ